MAACAGPGRRAARGGRAGGRRNREGGRRRPSWGSAARLATPQRPSRPRQAGLASPGRGGITRERQEQSLPAHSGSERRKDRSMTRPLWQPSSERIAASNLTGFMARLRQERGLDFKDYDDLYDWSVRDLEGFWTAVWDFCGVIADATPIGRAHV